MKINGGRNFDPTYNSSNPLSEGGLERTGQCESKPNSIDWINGYNPGRDYDGDGYRQRDHRERGPIGDPQVAAEIRHLLHELEGLLRAGSSDTDRISFRNWGKAPIDVDRISFGKKTPVDADKISFGVEE